MDEIWKDIEGYEGLYQVSNLGRVKSLNFNHTNEEKILKPKKERKGYLRIGIYKNNIQKYYSVHRLVAEAFLSNTNNFPEVNHRDENKENNCVSNLEWCDKKYNCNYGTRNKRRVEKQSKQVFQLDLQGNFIKEWESTMECGRNGFIQSQISLCCNGKRNKHKGYIWKYKKDVV